MTSIGIDFGTTNSVAALYGSNGAEVISIGEPPAEWEELGGYSRLLPSVVNVDDEGRLRFGWDAKLTTSGRRFEAVKRLLKEEEVVNAGDHDFLVEEVAASIFRHIRSRVVGNGIDFGSAVITVPSNSRGLARYRTKVCAGLGEIEPIALLNEPTAAAMAFTLRHLRSDQSILVFDFGGGTLDVTVLEARDGVFFEQASKGIPQLGGMDFDAAIMRAIAEDIPGSEQWTPELKARVRIEIEKAKIRLSAGNIDETVIVVEGAIPGYRLTLPRFNEITRHLVERSGSAIEAVMRDLRMGPGDVDALLLVGGTSKVPSVRQFAAEKVGREPEPGVDPMTAIAEGASIAAAILDGRLDNHDFFVSTEHALGTVALDVQARDLRFATVIPRNQKLPARQTEVFYPIFDGQESVMVQVVEGDPEKALNHPDNQILTEFEVPIDPPRPIDQAGFELTYTYDTDGLLHVEVKDMVTGQALTDAVTVSFRGARGGGELVSMAGKVRSMVDSGRVEESTTSTPAVHDPRSADLLTKARTRVIPFLDESDAEPLVELCAALEAADVDHREQLQDQLERELRKYSYLF